MGDSKTDNMVLFIKFEDDKKDDHYAYESKFKTPSSGSGMSPEEMECMAQMMIDDGYCTRIDRCRKAI